MEHLGDDFTYFDPEIPVGHLSGNLPHWRQEGVMYFVTFHLADSIAQDKLSQWKQERAVWLTAHPEPHSPEVRKEFYVHFVQRLQRWLDAGHGSCILRQQSVKELVEGALRFFDGRRYSLDEFVVMPNHVHVLVVPTNSYELSDVLHSWKSYTSHEINRMLRKRGDNWQEESFDHIVRSPEHLERTREYIRNNPKPVHGSQD